MNKKVAELESKLIIIHEDIQRVFIKIDEDIKTIRKDIKKMKD